MKFKLVESFDLNKEKNIAQQLYFGDRKEMLRLRTQLRKDAGIFGGSSLGIYVVENDDHTYDVYEDLELIESDFKSWEDVVNYCRFLDRGTIHYGDRRVNYRLNPRTEAIIYNNDKFSKALKSLIEDKINIRTYDYEKHLLALWKDDMSPDEIIKKYHLDKQLIKNPELMDVQELPGMIHGTKWAGSRYKGGVSYNDWSGDSPFDEYGEVYENLDIKDLDDEIQISREY
jgi:hypothetical protein